jgi:phosphate transport system substrate-binding protein
MIRKTTLLTAFSLLLLTGLNSCKKDRSAQQDAPKETMLSGETTVFVDESLFPIVEDQVNVFENTYKKAKVNIASGPESEIINAFLSGKDTTKLTILTRTLTSDEEAMFKQEGINPKINRFAIDAIALIANKTQQDSIIELDEVLAYIKGESSKIEGLVFDNPNSSASRILHEKAGTERGTNKNVFSRKSSQELIKYIAENPGYIGVVGVNWFTQTPKELFQYTEKVTILGVRNVKNGDENQKYYLPTQANIGKKLYPLTRDIYLLNYQGSTGLGMGFASFIASDIGQKIVLTSGLAPVKVEQLKVNVIKNNN